MAKTLTEPHSVLSDIIHHMKYAKFDPDTKRREIFAETVSRNAEMHIKKFPSLKKEILESYKLVHQRKILPSMRALEDSTPIITKDGWKTAGQVKQGDILYASDGTETTVQDVVKFENKELFDVTFSDGSTIKACAEHLWIVSTLDDRPETKTRVVDTLYIRDHLKQGSRYNICVCNPDPIQRNTQDLLIDPYILGHWLGDGYQSGYQISCSVEDAEHIASQYKQRGFNTEQSSSTNIWTHSVHGLHDLLKEYGLIDKKHIPQPYLHSSVEQRLSLLQGLMDSDGCIEPSGRCHFGNTNQDIISGVEELLSSLGIKYIKTTTPKKKPHHLELFTLSFFTSLPIATLPRKFSNIRRNPSQRTEHRTVKTVKSVGNGNATCFHVDSFDHSFLAGKQMIVTHNSMQFAGKAIFTNPARMYNCSFTHIDNPSVFQEVFFLLLSGCGVGYALDLNTPIPTPTGWTTMGEVKPGQQVFDETGSTCNVTGVSDIMKDHQCFEVVFSDGSVIVADEDHLWRIQTRGQRSSEKRNIDSHQRSYSDYHKIVPTRELQVGDSIEVAGPIQTENARLPINPYVLGYWLGDGTSTNSIISTADDEIIEEFEKEGFPTKHLRKYDFYVYGGLHKQLTRNNLFGNKHIPEVYLRSSYQQRLSLLQGLMDSDGCCSKKGQCSFLQKSETLARQVLEVVLSLGIKATIKDRILNETIMWYVTFTTNIPVFRLRRKLERQRLHQNSPESRRRFVAEVKETASVPVKCITVDSNSHLFLAGESFIPTHNSIQQHHVDKLPSIRIPTSKKQFFIEDSIEGWSTAVNALMISFFSGTPCPEFVYDNIRPQGSLLKTSGGRAPGHEPLQEALDLITEMLWSKKDNSKLTPLECHDILCYMAAAVLAGGIRRSSFIAIFSPEDTAMMNCKTGNWLKDNPQRRLANNSAAFLRSELTEKTFWNFWDKLSKNGNGEPNIFQTNSLEWGCNPSLRKGTRVLTSEGIFPIEQLEDREFYINNLNGEKSPAKCWLSGKDKPLFKITLQSGKQYFSTAEHKWPVWNGTGYEKTKTTNLCAGDFLPVIRTNQLFEGTLGTYEDGFTVGWLYGDGWITTRTDDGRQQYGFIVSKEDQQYEIHNRLQETIQRKTGCKAEFHNRKGNAELNTSHEKLHKYFQQFGVTSKENGLPKAVWEKGSESFRKGLIDGLFSSNGQVESSKKRLSFHSSKEKLIQDVSDLLGFYGIRHTIITQHCNGDFPNKKHYGKTYTLYSIRITGGRSIQHFTNLFSLTHKDKQQRLDEYKHIRFFEKDQIEILSIEETNLTENVWDINVNDSTHCFQISHCITGNCGEIGGPSNFFCNLVEINASNILNQEDLNLRSRTASFIATLQSSYTNFHFLRPIWMKKAEEAGLIGVGMTGIASGNVLNLDLTQAAHHVLEQNAITAKQLNLPLAERATTVKPSGTASLLLSNGTLCSSGIHAYHSQYMRRRVTVMHSEPIYKFLLEHNPNILEESIYNPEKESFITIPLIAPTNCITRNEGPIHLLERIRKINLEWIRPAHRKGVNYNNVSSTVDVKDHEWEEVGRWCWKHRKDYVSITFLPHDGATYPQMPVEEIDRNTFISDSEKIGSIDLKELREEEDNTKLQQEAACSGGSRCDITYL